MYIIAADLHSYSLAFWPSHHFLLNLDLLAIKFHACNLKDAHDEVFCCLLHLMILLFFFHVHTVSFWEQCLQNSFSPLSFTM